MKTWTRIRTLIGAAMVVVSRLVATAVQKLQRPAAGAVVHPGLKETHRQYVFGAITRQAYEAARGRRTGKRGNRAP